VAGVVPDAAPGVTERIRERARALGFAAVGVAPVEPLDEPARRLAEWLRAGRHGTMRYMERHAEARRDPGALLPGARSIVSLAANYHTARCAPGDGGPGRGKVSRYAWGRDYHAVLRERMEALLAEIREMLPGCEGRVATDATPLLEKAIAERAGIGWIGKHTNLITRTHGSWVFLGEILLTAPLDYDDPFPEDFCGTCALCIEACPTGAIVAPYQLDAARCISYATIEHRGEIPAGFRGRMDGWVYGCDVCQDVCPWNRFAEETPIEEFSPRDGVLDLTLEDMAALPAARYHALFEGSAMRRARREGLARNARFLLEEGSGRPARDERREGTP
jgi:epoxyqueuosine reductase